MATLNELKPCPFCGGEAIFGQVTDPVSEDFDGHFITCTKCPATTDLRFACGDDPQPLLAEVWNRRSPDATVNALVEALETIAQSAGDPPCDCERCDCGNRGDADAMATWRAENSLAAIARRALSAFEQEGRS